RSWTMSSGIQNSSNNDQARTSAVGPSMRSSPDRVPCASSDLRSRRRAEKDDPRLVLVGGDSRSHASWMLYSSLKRFTTLMLIHINASTFSTAVPSARSTFVHADCAFVVKDRMIDASNSSLDPTSR